MTNKIMLAAWLIITGFILLFSPTLFAEPFINIEGNIVTMDKETYERGVNQMTFQAEQIARLGGRVELLEQRYNYVEQCVKNNAVSGNAATPCFNVNKDPSGQDIMSIQDLEDVNRFIKNTTEF